ncbi:luciferin sulfotransferase [Nilaparvata lugens]|uniref:luciferin sulfotransferase n=1 Tax=Nilaparvata lugens TaxID=108931 RepID=UPI00193DB0EA|nr:luciferin sulfotransferase [Nilaparvata lugens]
MHIKYGRPEPVFAHKMDALFKRKDCMIEVNPGSVLLPPKYQDIGERIINLEVRPDDVWLVSFPRTGSTWTQEMVWCICNDLDYERAQQPGIFRTPLIELTAVLGNEEGDWKEELGNSVDLVEAMPKGQPRFIKTHLPLELLPKQLTIVKPKIVYVARNPKDMCVSYYHYCKLVHNLDGPFEDFCELFLANKAPYGPIWDHIRGFWKLHKESDNVMFVKYEDMKKNHVQCIKDTTKFFNKPELSDTQIQSLIDHLSFNKMKENPALNLEAFLKVKNGENFQSKDDNEKFIRKGVIGDWKNYMSPELSAKFDKWMEENLKDTGLTFEMN